MILIDDPLGAYAETLYLTGIVFRNILLYQVAS